MSKDKNLYYCIECNNVYENCPSTPTCTHKKDWFIISKRTYIDWILNNKSVLDISVGLK